MHLSIASHPHRGGHHFAKAVHYFFALVFLNKGKYRVQQHHSKKSGGNIEVTLTRIQLLGHQCQGTTHHK